MRGSLKVLEREIARAQQFSMRVGRAAPLPPRSRRLNDQLSSVAASRALTGFSWSDYFPFAKGTRYRVDGPMGYDGSGEVSVNSGPVLGFSLDMPKYFKIPKAHVVLEITFRQRGRGNTVRATVNGELHEDPDATIQIDDGSRTVTIRSSREIPGFDLQWVRFSPDGANEIDVDIKIDGEEYDFDLERKRSSEAQGLVVPHRYARAQSPAAAIEGAALGYSVLRDIADNKGDISWQLKALDGSYHPHHDQWSRDEQERYGAGPWETRKERIHARMKARIGAEISATFELSFQHNGHYIANVDVEPVGTNDLVFWGLHVHGRIVKDAGEFWHPETNAGPFAHLSYVFNYRFSGSMWEDAIFVARYELYGDGQVGWNREWKQ